MKSKKEIFEKFNEIKEYRNDPNSNYLFFTPIEIDAQIKIIEWALDKTEIYIISKIRELETAIKLNAYRYLELNEKQIISQLFILNWIMNRDIRIENIIGTNYKLILNHGIIGSGKKYTMIKEASLLNYEYEDEKNESISLNGITLSDYKDNMGFDFYVLKYNGKKIMINKYAKCQFVFEEIKKLKGEE